MILTETKNLMLTLISNSLIFKSIGQRDLVRLMFKEQLDEGMNKKLRNFI